jgi:hypothetical protein
MIKTPIIGFVRYSCRATFSRSDFFNPKNMDYRLEIFKNITLKSFQEQDDKDFTIFLLHSENLPQKYKEIFEDMENNNSFLHNIYIPDSEVEGKDYIDAVTGSVEYVNFCNNISVNFRIDNDDALPRNFISRLKNFLKPEFIDCIISVARVSIVQRVHKDKFLVQEKFFPSNSIGLAYVTCKNDYKTIMTLGDHGKVNQKHPMLLLPERGGLQTINGKNIGNALYFGYVPSFNEVSLRTYLKENNYADFDLKCLRICKRHQFLSLIVKTYNYFKKKRQEKSNLLKEKKREKNNVPA